MFTLENLRCGYAAGFPVLRMEGLEIPRGKLIFVVGVSGGGKSTLIETLGLMNHTTGHDGLGGRVIYRAKNGETTDLLELWANQDDTILSAFRQRHFSFIFQQTNLMPNFSSGDNMLITALFAGKNREAAEAKIRQLMADINLPDRAFDAPIQELSGGQRQRLAFIRALVADFEVLFGDEPTGNLDNATARECMRLLQREIKGTERTAIIVSHDLELAAEFADMIIPISLISEGGQLRGVLNTPRMLSTTETGEMKARNGTTVTAPAAYLEEHIFNSPT